MRDPRLSTTLPTRDPGQARLDTQSDMTTGFHAPNGSPGPSSRHGYQDGPRVGQEQMEAMNSIGRLRPRSMGGMNHAYDDLYRAQLNGATENPPRDPSPEPSTTDPTRLAPLVRTRSDHGPRMEQDPGFSDDGRHGDDPTWKMRHGWEDEHTSEYMSLLHSVSMKVVGT